MSGVLVLGSHRSGTSAVTEALASLGLYTGAAERLKAGSTVNERGFWEVTELIRFNEGLLARLGGAWDAPPAPGSLRDVDPALRAKGAALFGDVFDRRPWVWKDPRASILLDFWRPALPGSLAAVACHRDPIEVARSLHTRDGMPMKVGLALWECYERAILRGAEGLPTLIVPYASLLEEPDEWQATATDFLSRAGLALRGNPSASAWAGVLDTRLRRERRSGRDDFELSSGQAELVALLVELTGTHVPLSHVDLPPETPGLQDLFDARSHARRMGEAAARSRADAELRTLRKRLTQVESSLSWRLTGPVRWAAGAGRALGRHRRDR